VELLEIEKELKGPGSEAALAKYDEILVALDARRRAALREGLPREEYARAAELGEAIVVARKLLRLQTRS